MQDKQVIATLCHLWSVVSSMWNLWPYSLTTLQLYVFAHDVCKVLSVDNLEVIMIFIMCMELAFAVVKIFAYLAFADLINVLFSESSADSNCITSFQILAETGAVRDAGFSYATTHQVALQLHNGTMLKGNLIGPVFYNSKQEWHLNPATDFQPNLQCLKPTDIAKVSIVAGGDDNWYITKIATNTKVGVGAYKGLTNDPALYKWLDDQSPASSELVLSLGMSKSNVHKPPCTFGIPVCECKLNADICVFNLEVDEILTFTSYPKLKLGGSGSGIIMRGLEAALWHI